MTEKTSAEALMDHYMRQRRRGAILVIGGLLALLLVAILFPPPPQYPPPATSPETLSKLGVHLLLDDGRGSWPVTLWRTHMQYAARAVGDWGYVAQIVRSDDLDTARWQQFMDLCADLHLTPILRLATVYDRAANYWAAPDVNDGDGYSVIAGRYAAFIAALQWPTDRHFVIVGNEPNHGDEWGGTPSPAAYAHFLAAVADALHAADPGVQILNAAFDSFTPNTGNTPLDDGYTYMDAESFMDGMVAAVPDVFSRVDIWNSHAYPLNHFSAPPWQQRYAVDSVDAASNPHHTPPPDGIFNQGINGYEWDLWKLAQYGITNLPIMITETGWRHSEAVDANSLDGGADYPDDNTTARYLDLALWGNNGRYPDMPESGWTPLLTDSRVLAVVAFALDGKPAEWSHTNWLVLDADGKVWATYTALNMYMSWRAPAR